jgi:hypothetical protein
MARTEAGIIGASVQLLDLQLGLRCHSWGCYLLVKTSSILSGSSICRLNDEQREAQLAFLAKSRVSSK